MLSQHVKDVSRFRGDNKPSRVDLVFANEEDMISEMEYQSPLGKSDHKVLVFQADITVKRNIKLDKKRIYKKANLEGMVEDMNLDWETTLNNKENSLIDQHIPTCIIDNSKGMRPPLDEKMKELIRQKDIAARKLTESKKQEADMKSIWRRTITKR